MSEEPAKRTTIHFDDREHYENRVISKKRSDEEISVHSITSGMNPEQRELPADASASQTSLMVLKDKARRKSMASQFEYKPSLENMDEKLFLDQLNGSESNNKESETRDSHLSYSKNQSGKNENPRIGAGFTEAFLNVLLCRGNVGESLD